MSVNWSEQESNVNDRELERQLEQAEEARSVRGGQVIVVYLLALAMLGLLTLAGGMSALLATGGVP